MGEKSEKQVQINRDGKKLEQKNKIILLFFIVLAISYSIVLAYFETTLPKPPTEKMDESVTKTLIYDKYVKANQTQVFTILSNLEQFPIILPEHVFSVTIINKTQDVTYANVELFMGGIKENVLLKHSVKSNIQQTFEVMNGEAKGTKITQDFVYIEEEQLTQIKTTTELNVKGFLKFITQIRPYTYSQLLNPMIDNLVLYAQGFENKSVELVDQIYLEILRRHADPEGLRYFVVLLESDQITPDEIREQLLNSEEKKFLLELHEIKSINQLDDETKEIVKNLYQEILYRPVDISGLQHYGSMLEANKITTKDLRNILLESEERKYALTKSEKKSNYDLKYETRIAVNELYKELLFRTVDSDGLAYYGSLLEANKITTEDLRNILLESEERRVFMSNPALIEYRLATDEP